MAEDLAEIASSVSDGSMYTGLVGTSVAILLGARWDAKIDPWVLRGTQIGKASTLLTLGTVFISLCATHEAKYIDAMAELIDKANFDSALGVALTIHHDVRSPEGRGLYALNRSKGDLFMYAFDGAEFSQPPSTVNIGAVVSTSNPVEGYTFLYDVPSLFALNEALHEFKGTSDPASRGAEPTESEVMIEVGFPHPDLLKPIDGGIPLEYMGQSFN